MAIDLCNLYYWPKLRKLDYGKTLHSVSVCHLKMKIWNFNIHSKNCHVKIQTLLSTCWIHGNNTKTRAREIQFSQERFSFSCEKWRAIESLPQGMSKQATTWGVFREKHAVSPAPCQHAPFISSGLTSQTRAETTQYLCLTTPIVWRCNYQAPCSYIPTHSTTDCVFKEFMH